MSDGAALGFCAHSGWTVAVAVYTTAYDAPLTYTFNEAKKYALGLNNQKGNDHDDWHVPTNGELNVLCGDQRV